MHGSVAWHFAIPHDSSMGEDPRWMLFSQDFGTLGTSGVLLTWKWCVWSHQQGCSVCKFYCKISPETPGVRKWFGRKFVTLDDMPCHESFSCFVAELALLAFTCFSKGSDWLSCWLDLFLSPTFCTGLTGSIENAAEMWHCSTWASNPNVCLIGISQLRGL